ncbi:MAG: GIY-YIG nuclease family protein [Asgard group archaeon]|nr:GIY-YIG nuclease family protein [Asgard group archaeon]
MPYFVYMVKCSDDSIYTGYTKQLQKRIHQHNHTKKGARYTRYRRPVKLAYYEIYKKQKNAMRRELAIKSLSRDKKLKLIKHFRIKKPYNPKLLEKIPNCLSCS